MKTLLIFLSFMFLVFNSVNAQTYNIGWTSDHLDINTIMKVYNDSVKIGANANNELRLQSSGIIFSMYDFEPTRFWRYSITGSSEYYQDIPTSSGQYNWRYNNNVRYRMYDTLFATHSSNTSSLGTFDIPWKKVVSVDSYVSNSMVGGYWQPGQISDATAPNNSVYYSTTQSKLVYKDPGGTVNPLY